MCGLRAPKLCQICYIIAFNHYNGPSLTASRSSLPLSLRSMNWGLLYIDGAFGCVNVLLVVSKSGHFYVLMFRLAVYCDLVCLYINVPLPF